MPNFNPSEHPDLQAARLTGWVQTGTRPDGGVSEYETLFKFESGRVWVFRPGQVEWTPWAPCIAVGDLEEFFALCLDQLQADIEVRFSGNEFLVSLFARDKEDMRRGHGQSTSLLEAVLIAGDKYASEDR